MRFDSLLYLFYLPVVWFCWYFTPERYRWVVLLAASYLFYACVGAPYLLIVLAAVTVSTYTVGQGPPDFLYDRAKAVLFWTGTSFCLLFLMPLKFLPVVL